VIDSCAILLTVTGGPVAELHDRMPVILAPKYFDLCLDPEEQNVEHLTLFLKASAAEALTLHPDPKYVNKPVHERNASKDTCRR